MQLTNQRAVVCSFRFKETVLQISKSNIPIYCVLDGGTIKRGGFLGDVRNAPVPREVHLPLVGVQLAAQKREQAGLARAVGADQADALARVERDIGALEQRLGPPDQGDLGKADQAGTMVESAGMAGTEPVDFSD